MEIQKPKVVNFVSGKGGVGKTMVSVAFAYEMAQQNRVIIFDLDFFNRGLTGLLRNGETICEIARPSFLSETASESGPWSLVRVSPRLYHVQYPDLNEKEIQSLETLPINELFSKLRDYVDYLAQQVMAEVIILDCHGGPDPLSFAACALANPSILVSEPDKITFYGTMHFVRQLESTCGPDSINNLHLVFNKVIPAFSIPYLTRFYDQKLREQFREKPLLSVIPLEVYLTKEFERVPFITSVFPYSELAKKVRLLAWDLFHESAPELLSKSARHLNRLDRLTTRYALGKKNFILNTDAIMAIIAVFALLSVAGAQWYNHTGETLRTLFNYSANAHLYKDIISNPSRAPKPCIQANDPQGTADCASRLCFDQFNSSSLREEDDGLTLVGSPTYLQSWNQDCYPFQYLRETLQEAKDYVNWGIAHPSIMKQDVSFVLRELPSMTSLQLYAIVGGTFTPTAVSLVLWFAFALILNWTAALDRLFTYSWRAHNAAGVTLSALCVLSLWFLCSFYYGMNGDLVASVPIWLVAFGYTPAAIEVSRQLYRVYKQILGERRFIEAGVRFAFAILLIAQPIITHYVTEGR